jgi:hypothetical protein
MKGPDHVGSPPTSCTSTTSWSRTDADRMARMHAEVLDIENGTTPEVRPDIVAATPATPQAG